MTVEDSASQEKTFVNSATGEELDIRVRFSNTYNFSQDITEDKIRSHSIKEIFSAKAENGGLGITVNFEHSKTSVDFRCVGNVIIITVVDPGLAEHNLPV